MLGVIFYLILAASVASLGKLYHTDMVTNSIILASVMLCLSALGFQISLIFIQRIIFFLALLLFPSNIILSTTLNTNFGKGLEPLGGSLLIIGLITLSFLRR